MLRVSLAPCSPFTVTNGLMIAAAAIARRHPGVRLHTHLAENQEDVDYSLKVYGVRPGEYLKCGSEERGRFWSRVFGRPVEFSDIGVYAEMRALCTVAGGVNCSFVDRTSRVWTWFLSRVFITYAQGSIFVVVGLRLNGRYQ